MLSNGREIFPMYIPRCVQGKTSSHFANKTLYFKTTQYLLFSCFDWMGGNGRIFLHVAW